MGTAIKDVQATQPGGLTPDKNVCEHYNPSQGLINKDLESLAKACVQSLQ